jgi:hypothetical protein
MSKTKKFNVDMKDIMEEIRKSQEKKLEQSKANAKILFDALQDTRVVSINVDFDGCGDSGQISSIEYYDHREKGLPEPSGEIKGSKLPAGHHWNSKTNNFEELPEREGGFNELVEQICYDRLGAKHGGWEINEGSYGTFTFDVLNRKIELEFNERVESVRSTSESF